MKNTRIILKMLRVFSNQLRRIHKQVLNLLSAGESVSSEKGLFHIGEYYRKKGQNSQALYAFRRYLTYYPSGDYASQTLTHIQEVETLVSQGKDTPPPSMNGEADLQGQGLSDVARRYQNAVNLFSEQKYDEALNEFRAISEKGADREYLAKASFEIGRCFFNLNNFEACIKHYIEMVQKYPKHPELVETLFYVGASHEKKGDLTKASSFYNKILKIAEDNSPVLRKTQKALKALEGV